MFFSFCIILITIFNEEKKITLKKIKVCGIMHLSFLHFEMFECEWVHECVFSCVYYECMSSFVCVVSI